MNRRLRLAAAAAQSRQPLKGSNGVSILFQGPVSLEIRRLEVGYHC